MGPWKEDLVHELLNIEREQEIFSLATDLARGLGFDYYSYVLRMPVPLTRPKIVVYSNYPSDWQTIYQKNGYMGVDPLIQRAIGSLPPVLWSDDLFETTPDLWEEAQSFGLQAGLAQACRDPNGMIGLQVLARSGEPVTSTEWQMKAGHMLWLVQSMHMRITQIVAPRLLTALTVELTKREAEVLRWAGDGKTAGEIAAILQISERTVNFHISNVITKLQVTNKTAAVLQASLLGLL